MDIIHIGASSFGLRAAGVAPVVPVEPVVLPVLFKNVSYGLNSPGILGTVPADDNERMMRLSVVITTGSYNGPAPIQVRMQFMDLYGGSRDEVVCTLDHNGQANATALFIVRRGSDLVLRCSNGEGVAYGVTTCVEVLVTSRI